MSNIIIIGAGGFGLEVAAYIEDIMRAGKASHTIKGFLDDTRPAGSHHAGHNVLGPTDSAIDPECLYIVAVGTPEGRKTLAEKLASKGARFFSAIHPSSYVATSAKISPGTITAPFTFVGPNAHIGNHCLLNIYASVGHESGVGDYCVLSPYATIHGSAVLEAGVFMGSHACVTKELRVSNGAKIAAGAVVYQEIPAGARVMGNPAAHRQN